MARSLLYACEADVIQPDGAVGGCLCPEPQLALETPLVTPLVTPLLRGEEDDSDPPGLPFTGRGEPIQLLVVEEHLRWMDLWICGLGRVRNACIKVTSQQGKDLGKVTCPASK
jgi:hypothetical protein